MRISFVGAGNVAWHLAMALENAGHDILEIYSRDPRNARQLVAKLYDATTNDSLDFSESQAEVIFLTVPDDAISKVVPPLVLPENCTLVHTSGTTSLEHLSKLLEIHSDVPANAGVFYPLQTFTKDLSLDFSVIPICIEADDKTTEQILIDIAQDISQTVYLMNSEERRVLHLGAVFACNFTNHLLAVAKQIVEAENLEFDLLKPLIEETIRKGLEANDPAQVQTGPARRGDFKTMKLHLNYLNQHPDLQSIYELMSDNIRKYSH